MTPIESARGLGPLIEKFPARMNRNAAYDLASAVFEIDWRQLPPEVKQEIATLAHQLRRHLIL